MKSKKFLAAVAMAAALALLGACSPQSEEPTEPTVAELIEGAYTQYDLRVGAGLGLSPDDMAAIRQVAGVDYVEGVHEQRVTWSAGAVLVRSVPERIGQLTPLRGRMPETSGEILVDDRLAAALGVQLGDRLPLEEEFFFRPEAVVVGLVAGAADAGGDYTAYLTVDGFAADGYTAAYLAVLPGAAVAAVQAELESICDARVQARYEALLAQKQQEIEERERLAEVTLEPIRQALEETAAQLEEAAKKLADGEKQLADAAKKLSDADRELTELRRTLDESNRKLEETAGLIADGEQELAQAEKELLAVHDELERNRTKLKEARRQIDTEREPYDKALKDNRLQESELDDKLKEVRTALPDAQSAVEQYRQRLNEIDAEKAALGDEITAEQEQEFTVRRVLVQVELLAAQTEVSVLKKLQTSVEQLIEARDKIAAAEEEYRTAADTFAAAEAEYNEALDTFNDKQDELIKGKQAYEQGLADYRKGEQTYNEGLQAYRDGQSEYDRKQREYTKQKAAYDDARQPYEEALRQYQADKEKNDRELERYRRELENLQMAPWVITEKEAAGT